MIDELELYIARLWAKLPETSKTTLSKQRIRDIADKLMNKGIFKKKETKRNMNTEIMKILREEELGNDIIDKSYWSKRRKIISFYEYPDIDTWDSLGFINLKMFTNSIKIFIPFYTDYYLRFEPDQNAIGRKTRVSSLSRSMKMRLYTQNKTITPHPGTMDITIESMDTGTVDNNEKKKLDIILRYQKACNEISRCTGGKRCVMNTPKILISYWNPPNTHHIRADLPIEVMNMHPIFRQYGDIYNGDTIEIFRIAYRKVFYYNHWDNSTKKYLSHFSDTSVDRANAFYNAYYITTTLPDDYKINPPDVTMFNLLEKIKERFSKNIPESNDTVVYNSILKIINVIITENFPRKWSDYVIRFMNFVYQINIEIKEILNLTKKNSDYKESELKLDYEKIRKVIIPYFTIRSGPIYSNSSITPYEIMVEWTNKYRYVKKPLLAIVWPPPPLTEILTEYEIHQNHISVVFEHLQNIKALIEVDATTRFKQIMKWCYLNCIDQIIADGDININLCSDSGKSFLGYTCGIWGYVLQYRIEPIVELMPTSKEFTFEEISKYYKTIHNPTPTNWFIYPKTSTKTTYLGLFEPDNILGDLRYYISSYKLDVLYNRICTGVVNSYCRYVTYKTFVTEKQSTYELQYSISKEDSHYFYLTEIMDYYIREGVNFLTDPLKSRFMFTILGEDVSIIVKGPPPLTLVYPSAINYPRTIPIYIVLKDKIVIILDRTPFYYITKDGDDINDISNYIKDGIPDFSAIYPAGFTWYDETNKQYSLLVAGDIENYNKKILDPIYPSSSTDFTNLPRNMALFVSGGITNNIKIYRNIIASLTGNLSQQTHLTYLNFNPIRNVSATETTYLYPYECLYLQDFFKNILKNGSVLTTEISQCSRNDLCGIFTTPLLLLAGTDIYLKKGLYKEGDYVITPFGRSMYMQYDDPKLTDTDCTFVKYLVDYNEKNIKVPKGYGNKTLSIYTYTISTIKGTFQIGDTVENGDSSKKVLIINDTGVVDEFDVITETETFNSKESIYSSSKTNEGNLKSKRKSRISETIYTLEISLPSVHADEFKVCDLIIDRPTIPTAPSLLDNCVVVVFSYPKIGTQQKVEVRKIKGTLTTGNTIETYSTLNGTTGTNGILDKQEESDRHKDNLVVVKIKMDNSKYPQHLRSKYVHYILPERYVFPNTLFNRTKIKEIVEGQGDYKISTEIMKDITIKQLLIDTNIVLKTNIEKNCMSIIKYLERRKIESLSFYKLMSILKEGYRNITNYSLNINHIYVNWLKKTYPIKPTSDRSYLLPYMVYINDIIIDLFFHSKYVYTTPILSVIPTVGSTYNGKLPCIPVSNIPRVSIPRPPVLYLSDLIKSLEEFLSTIKTDPVLWGEVDNYINDLKTKRSDDLDNDNLVAESGKVISIIDKIIEIGGISINDREKIYLDEIKS